VRSRFISPSSSAQIAFNTDAPQTRFHDPYCLPNLQTLSLIVDVEANTVFHFEYLLSRLGLPNLQQIRFRLVLSDQRTMDWDWLAIDDILNRQAFASLRNVRIFSETEGQWLRDRTRQEIVDHFPLLISRGILEVEIQEQS
jgi:hypothetical protein